VGRAFPFLFHSGRGPIEVRSECDPEWLGGEAAVAAPWKGEGGSLPAGL
jgi:hypothetical protein